MMDTKRAIEIIERLKEAYEKNEQAEDIVTALNFAIDSLVIVKDIIDENWGDDNLENLS